MSFDFATLITDRQKSDADYARALIGKITKGTATAEELAAWNAATLKGVYDYTDLNRVTAAMDEINSQFSAAGYKTGYEKIRVRGYRLPAGYKELESIESSGNQYINSEFYPTWESQIVIDCALASLTNNWACLFGASANNQNKNSFSAWLDPENIPYYYYHDSNSKINGFSNLTVRTVLDCNQNIMTVNGMNTVMNKLEFSTGYPVFLCAQNYGGTLAFYSCLRIYGCKMYGNGLQRFFIPCINPIGEAGLYDFISKKFYGSSGSGKFIAGQERPENEIYPDDSDPNPYTWYEDDKPTTVQISQYLANVRALRATIANLSPEVPEAKDMFSVEAANNIEKILLAIERAIQTMKQTYVPCGATVCGGDYL